MCTNPRRELVGSAASLFRGSRRWSDGGEVGARSLYGPCEGDAPEPRPTREMTLQERV